MKHQVPERMSYEEGFNELTDFFLGKDFYIVDPVDIDRGISIVVETIESEYKRSYKLHSINYLSIATIAFIVGYIVSELINYFS